MRTVHLYGDLAEKFTPKIDLEVATIWDAVKGLECNFPGFRSHIVNGKYYILRGDDFDMKKKLKKTEVFETSQLGMLTTKGDFHIIPQVVGAKSQAMKGILMLVAGIALAGVGVAGALGAFAATSGGSALAVAGTVAPGAIGLLSAAGIGVTASTIASTAFLGLSFGSVILAGAAFALGGVSTLLTPTPRVDNFEDSEREQSSFLFNGAINTVVEGGPIPILYGQLRIGSIVVSASIETHELVINNPDRTASGPIGDGSKSSKFNTIVYSEP